VSVRAVGQEFWSSKNNSSNSTGGLYTRVDRDHPAISVAGEFFDDCLNAVDEIPIIFGIVLWLVVVCAAVRVYEFAPLSALLRR
jgi:hypothetical protein